MARIRDARSEPYYDYSADELAAGYISVLAVPGRPLQNREINSISGLIYGNVRRVTDIIVENGTIISGCNFVKDDSDSDNIKCILSPGNIYFSGLVIPINVPEAGKEWSYNEDELLSEVPHGIAIVCVEVLPYSVSELDDPALTDPAENYDSYGVPGAHRLKYVATPQIMSESDFSKVSGTNKNLVSIIQINNGEIVGPTKPKPVFGLMRDWIAQRTYDEVGNYIARGLKVEVHSSEDIENVNETYTIHITPGKVYINGYDYFYNNKTILESKSAVDTFSTKSVPESHEYVTGTDTYQLNNSNVSSIDSIIGEVEITGIPVRARVTTDEIPEEYVPVASVTRVYKKTGTGSSDITVIPETLYYIESNRRIVWNVPAGMSDYRPALGTTYYIDIVKSDSFTPNKDYIVDGDKIRFINENKKPRSGRSFYIYYSWYVSRIDLLYIDEQGNIKLINGIPNDEELLEEPKAPAGALTLSSIYVVPGVTPDSYKIKNFHVMRMPISEIRSIKKRLDNIEYSLAMSQLESDTQDKHSARESIVTLKNIFTESFDNLTKSDIGHFLTDCSIDIFSSELKLPISSSVLGIRDISMSDTSGESVEDPYILTNRVSGTVSVDWQIYATGYTDLNPFNYVKLKPEISITPGCSIYYDTKYSYVSNVFVPTAIFYSYKTLLDWWRHQNDHFFDSSENDENMAINNQKITGLRELDPPYIVAETIDIEGINYPPSTEIEFYVDDKKVYAFNSEDTDSDNTSGTLWTDSLGNFSGSFDLPNGLESGSHLVTARTVGGDFSSFTTFDGKIEMKSLKIFTSTSKTDQTTPAAYLRNYSANYNDPIAQSVKFSSDMYISALDVYFHSKANEGYVFFTIRTVENGVPSSTVLYEKMLSSDEIAISANDTSTPTKIVFNYPIYLAADTEYCFTFGSDKTGYTMWFAQVGDQEDVNTGNVVQVKNHNGTFFQGSGSGSWTSVNDTTLTFILYRADFKTETTFYTEAITSDIGNFSMFNISADYAKLDKTDIKVYYAINLSDSEIDEEDNWEYIPFEECIKIVNKTSYQTDGMKIRFKFVLSTEDSRISPIINLNSLELLLGKFSPKGNYLSKTITL